jgi:RNA polymerase-associated protein CTR9
VEIGSQFHLVSLVDELPAAIRTLDTLLQPPNPQKSPEATVILASLRAYARTGISSADIAQERTKARELFDRVMKGLETEDTRTNGNGNGHANNGLSMAARRINDDVDMHAEIARLWQGESLDRMGRALKEGLRISEASGRVGPRLLNNLGALYHLEGNLSEARVMYEGALTSAAGLGPEIGEGMSTSILYNLARVYEDGGDEVIAQEAYEKLLARHPEYVDGACHTCDCLHWY